MNKDEYREEVLKVLKEIRIDIKINNSLSLFIYIFLTFIVIIMLFK